MPLAYQDLNIEIVDLQPDGHFRVRILGKAPNGREMRNGQRRIAVLQTGRVEASSRSWTVVARPRPN